MREGYQKTLIGDIPNDWKLKRLKEVADFSNGKGHEQSIDKNGKYIVVNSKFISTDSRVKKFSNQNLCPLNKGDITIVMSDIPNGKAIAKCFIVDEDEKYTLNQRIGSLTAKEGVDTKFLYFVLNRNRYYLAFDNGVGQTNLKKDEVTDCPIQFPPLPEQQKIAEILSTVDAKIEIIDQQISETQELKKGLMQQLLTKGIGHTEFKDSALGKIPKSWEVVKLKDVAEYVKDGTHGTHKEVEAGIPLLSAKDIRNGKIHIPDNCRKLSNDDFNSIHRNFKLMDGDVLLTVVGSIGRIAIIEGYKNNYTFQRSVGYVRFNNENYPYFFKQFFQSEFFTKQLSLRSNASAQAGVYLGELSKIPIPVISYNEQKEIAEILTSFDDKLQVLSEKKTTYQELKQGLMQQLLTGKVRV
jgi:type I restriction enzyme S subunit